MHKLLLILVLLPTLALSQERLETIEVVDHAGESFSGFWEENKDGKIFSGKKNTVTNLKEIPQLQTNNYRQATSQTPGLLISEIPNESIAAMTFRGLGDPHESYNVLLLQDGIPVAADMYGYPAHYYSPALPMMERFQFIRGGAGLLYGPQPGGVVNYISRPLRPDQPLAGQASVSGGSYNLLTTNNALYGSRGRNSWGVEYFRRQGDGMQRTNADFYADYLQARNHHYAGKNTYKVSFNGYNSDHGNPGGYSKTDGERRNVFGRDRRKATREHDRLQVSRAQLALGLESKLDAVSELQVNIVGSAYRRYSKTQNGGVFGQTPNGTTNNIVTQNYYGYHGEARYLRNYQLAGNESTFSAGVLWYNLNSPIVSETGAGPNSQHGEVTRRIDRATNTNSLFAENRFSFGNLMVTPGIRVENIRQRMDERKRPAGGDLREVDSTVNVPLLGLGLAYHVSDESQVYANVSEAYKPVSYAEGLPISDPANQAVSGDIDPSKIVSYELGYRGQTRLVNWDASLFHIRYENKFGQVGSGAGLTWQNTGAGESRGVDAAGEFKLSNLIPALRAWGDFNLYANTAVLDARLTRGPLRDKAPMYAPKNISRAGIIHSRENRYKVALMGVVVSRHYGDDANTTNFEIPSYTVFDLTADVNVGKNWLVNLGVLNALDRDYYSRVRSDGIAWAMGRNYYAGATYKF